MKLCLIATAPMLLLAACGSETTDAPAQDDADATQTESGASEATAVELPDTAAAPPTAFAQCRACHTVDKDGRNGIGPNLWGVAGKPAAQKSGFAYSPAMKSSELTWDEATLDIYLKEPMKTVPGTKMAYAGLRNDEQRAEVIAYLDSLKD